MAFAAWVALFQLPEDDRMTTTTAAVMDAKRQQRPDLTRAANLIVAKSNQFRQEQGLELVEVNAKLAEAASYFADYMAATDKYSHTADGKTPSQRAKEHDYDYCLVSENIAYLSSSAGLSSEELAEKMVEGWKKSPEHRANMLDADVTESGVAVAHSGKTGNFYGVQMFGRPKSLSIGFVIDNRSEVPIEYTIGERTYELPRANRGIHQECLPADLTFYLPGESKPQRHTFRPHNGDQFIISGPANQLRIEKK
jgi:uncharacterized protein YkwD